MCFLRPFVFEGGVGGVGGDICREICPRDIDSLSCQSSSESRGEPLLLVKNLVSAQVSPSPNDNP